MIFDEKLNQTAVVWENPQPDGYGGFSYDAPREVACRFDEAVESVMTPEGAVVKSMGVVFAKEGFREGSWLMLGELEIDTQANPKKEPNAWRVVLREAIKSVDAQETLFVHYMNASG